MSLYREEPVVSARGSRATNDVCEQLGDGHFRIDGRELRVPMVIEDCSVVAAAFWVDAKAAQGLLAPSSLRVEEAFPGRTPLVLLGVQYRDNPLGDYGEAAILFPVRTGGRKARMPFGGLLSLLTGSAALLVYRMPVDQEFTTHAGRFIWGYPKYLARIDVALAEKSARVRLEQDGRLVFAFSAPATLSGRSYETRGTTLTAREGIVRSIAAKVEASAVAFRLGGEAPEIGDAHPLALELRSLGLPKTPILTASIRHARMHFEGARTL